MYTFDGPDLTADLDVGIVLEDHYWDDSDAAVVFKRLDRRTGDIRYVYHGNDGTSFPWNDTAQLDFLDPAVREQVIQTIIAVARRFPIIRFDAAMVLAKKHIERLWWPEPGQPGGIPSRAEHAMPKREFDRRMPVEFWREVVDRVAAEVPDTLLLAEAFWLLEGYFVRTLGMHRVYNSAFMHMLRDEDGEGYRKVIKDTIEFDPEILKRYVNFMSNPDEKTALEQFGKGDKYFGVAMVLATLPGLPMLGHGQVPGFSEKYGMEFRRATLDEQPDPWLLERHEREIFPLLHRRAWFAEAKDFLLYDLITSDGRVDEDVFAYSNGSGPERSLVVYHDRYGSTSGWIKDSARYARKSADGRKRLVRRSLAEGLGIPNEPGVFVAYRDARTGLESLRSARELWERGLHVSLDAYGGHVFWEFREIHDGGSGQWARLAARLGQRAVPSLEDTLRELQLEPVHAPLRAIFANKLGSAVLDGTARPATLRRAGAPVRGIPRRGGGGDGCHRRSGGRCGRRPATGRGGARGAGPPCLAARTRCAPGLVGALTDRGAGTRRGRGRDQSGLVRRAAPAGRPGRGPAGGRPRRGRGVDRRRPGPRAPHAAAAVRDPRPDTDRGRPSPRPLAGQRHRPDGDRAQHLGRRRVARSRPVRDTARVGAPPRRHRGRTEPPGRAGRARCRGPADGRRQGRGLSTRQADGGPGRVAGPIDRVPSDEDLETQGPHGTAAVDEGSPTMTTLAGGFPGVVHWPRRAPAPDCQTEPPRGAAMRR